MLSILPGRPQSTRQALCTVNWDGLRLVAYISGNNAIIFNGRREILAYLSVDEVESLYALSIEEESGNIALCNESNVFIYTPSGRDYGDLRWTRTYDLDCYSLRPVKSLSWGSPDELLVAGQTLSLWNLVNHGKPQVMWTSTLSSPVAVAYFSPDAGLIASCGEHDRMVKIWRRLSYEQDSTRFDVSYLPHPTAVTDIHWRKVWHHEQNLEDLLYTYCADKQIRVWSHSDHHSPSLMQVVSSIDTTESIQPRRLSMGSVSKNRFAFILDSRDLSRAAERALQTSRLGTGHALEHLIQIANRSPEICVVLDGLGHMSAWGLENAGYRNKQPCEKFNVALVDGVNITLPSTTALEDLVQIQAFANNDASASLCILVHTYSGQIDWYQGSFTEFFDTAARQDRVLLQSSWSGHASAIEKVVPSPDGTHFVSWTDTNRIIVWSQSTTGALIRQSRLKIEDEIVDVVLLNKQNIAVVLLEDSLEVWDIRVLAATRTQLIDLPHEDVRGLVVLEGGNSRSSEVVVGIVCKDFEIHAYKILSPSNSSSSTNGHCHRPNQIGTITYQNIENLRNDSNLQCNTFVNMCKRTKSLIVARKGKISTFDIVQSNASSVLAPVSTLETWITPSTVFAASRNFAALVHDDRHTISIWNTAAQLYEFVYSFDDRDEIHGLHWHELNDGLSLLAIRSAYTVFILSQCRYSSDKHHQPWTFHKPIRVREHSSNMIGSLCWINDCRIVISAGDQILAFEIEADSSQLDTGHDHSNRSTAFTPIQKTAISNSVLPIFHPTIISSLLCSARYAAVHTIFQALRDELRFTIEGDVVPFDLNLDPVKLFDFEEHTDHSSSLEFDTEDVTQLREAAPKISRKQISASGIQHLDRLISIYGQICENRTSLDKFALTYLQDFLLSIPTEGSDTGEIAALPYRAIVAASLSKSQEALVHFVMSHLDKHNIKLTWSTARCLGLFLFLQPPTVDDPSLQNYLETVARNEYNLDPDDRNPVNCSLYYLALNRKSVLQSLWRTTIGVKEKENTMKLLAHDFTQQRWKATALKNAYALLSRRRFEYAAAFFLLGGSLFDACNICVNQLHDMQLAIAIARVWSDSQASEQVLQNLTERSILSLAIDSLQARWIAIWGPIHRKGYREAVKIIVQQADLVFHDQFKARQEDESSDQRRNGPFEASSWQASDPKGLVEVYLHLRSILVDIDQWTIDVVTPRQEWEFVMRCVHWYRRSGMDHLALALVLNWEFVSWRDEKTSEKMAIGNGQVERSSAVQETPSMLDLWMDNTPVKPQKKRQSTDATETPKDVQPKAKPPPTQFVEPSASSLLDSFGF